MPKAGYIRIRPRFVLRGWKGSPYVLVDAVTSRPFFMQEDVFRTLRLCNGKFTAESPVFMGIRRRYLEEFDRLGLIDYTPEPSQLEPNQEYHAFDNYHLTRVHWSVTGRCNYRCRHCYMSAPHARLPQPSTKQCLDIVDQIADCGISRVTITGGEPLVRGDFLAIVDRIVERGLKLDVIMTNGSLVTRELLDALEARSLRPEFTFSYDGTQGWHNWMRGIDCAEDDLRRAAGLCRERGFTMNVEMVLHRGNAHTLRETVRFLGELGICSVKLLGLTCTGEAEALGAYALPYGEFLEACLAYAPLYVEDGMPVPILALGPVFKSFEGTLSVGEERGGDGGDENHGKMAICGMARDAMFLGPDGRILPCIPMAQADTLQDYFPKIESMSLAEALSDSNYLRFASTTLDTYLEHNPRCAACAYKYQCGAGCRGKALEANGGTDLLGVDPQTCLFFTGGYYERAKELVATLQGRAQDVWNARR